MGNSEAYQIRPLHHDLHLRKAARLVAHAMAFPRKGTPATIEPDSVEAAAQRIYAAFQNVARNPKGIVLGAFHQPDDRLVAATAVAPSELQALSTSQRGAELIAKHTGQPVKIHHIGWMASIGVEPEHRQRGLAKRLLDESLKFGSEHYLHLKGETLDATMRKHLRAAGFEKIGEQAGAGHAMDIFHKRIVRD